MAQDSISWRPTAVSEGWAALDLSLGSQIALLTVEQRQLRTAIESLNSSLAASRTLSAPAAETGKPASGDERKPPPLLQSAVALDTAMADLAVVMKLERSEREALSQANLKMASERPLAARGISAADLARVERGAVTAGIGRELSGSGERRDAVLGFTRDAVLMASAFRIDAEQSAELMAGWRTELKLDQAQVRDLADASSLLAQKFGVMPTDIGAVVRQAGTTPAEAGLSPEQTAAFSAVLLQAGMNKDQASGSLKTFSTALGTQASSQQQAAFAELRLDRNELSLAMKQDAPAAMVSLLEALGKAPADRQAGLAKSLFGNDEALLALQKDPAPLKTALAEVADKGRYASSVLGDKSALNQAAENGSDSLSGNWNRFSASLSRFSTTLGNAFAPVVEGLLVPLGELIDGLSGLAESMPKLAVAATASVVALTAVGLKALAGGMLANGLETAAAAINRRIAEKLGPESTDKADSSRQPGRRRNQRNRRGKRGPRVRNAGIGPAKNARNESRGKLDIKVQKKARTDRKAAPSASASQRKPTGSAAGSSLTLGFAGARPMNTLASTTGERLMAGTRALRGRLPGPLRVMDAGMQVFDAVREGDTRSMLSGLGVAGGGWAGASAGASAGAALGTLIFPGVGTAVGGALGGVLGGIAGSDIGSWLGDKLGNRISGSGNRLPDPGAVGSELTAKPADNRQVTFAPVIQINGLDQATARQLADTVMQQMQAQFVPMMMADPLAARRGTALTDGGD
ncbi:phage tail tape measure protein [Pseudomonas asplenii]|uniref:phage tail tape measure protein n=1 Tax=Pseudomonas asplenii TaxID=53407 RepID=UPI00235F3D61|nr:phage tail tape measure protein [Pseudomonas asplenii]